MFWVLVLKVASWNTTDKKRKKDHGTQIGFVNVLRYNLKIECCKNQKKGKSLMTFVEVLQETTVLSVLKNYKSRFEDIAKSTITLQ